MNIAPALSPLSACHGKHIACRLLQSKRFYHLFSCIPGILLCAALPDTSHATIVTSLPPLAGLVSILDAKADVHCLLPTGADAHDFQLTPKQVQRLKQADLLIRASRDDGHWPGLNTAAQQLDLWPEKDHAWLLPTEVRRILPRLAKRLQNLAPDRRQAIEQSLHQALLLCDKLEAEWEQALAPFREHGIIIQHPVWRRLCEHFNVPVWAVLEPRHHGSVRPRQLEHALKLLQIHPDILLWGDVRHSNRGLAWLSRHADGRHILRLDALGPCGMPWKKLMHLNLEHLPS